MNFGKFAFPDSLEHSNDSVDLNRKTLYQDLFEYDSPLFSTGRGKYEFTPVSEYEHDNPWKESFKHLVSFVILFVFMF